MAQSYDGSNDAHYASRTFSGTTFSVACWLYWSAFDNLGDQLYDIQNMTDGSRVAGLQPNSGAGVVLVYSRGNVDWSWAYYTRPSAAAWHHSVSIHNASLSTNEVDWYLDGVLQTPSSRPVNPNNTDIVGTGTQQVTLGATGSGAGGAASFGQCQIAEFAIWNTILDQAEITALSKRYSPAIIRPTSLIDYWPMIRAVESRAKNGVSLTAIDAPAVSDHVPMIYKRR